MKRRTRMAGLEWLRRKGRTFDKARVKVSKYYAADESYTGSPVWWFEFPGSAATENQSAFLDLLCEVAPDSSEFHHLRVPSAFFLARQPQLGYRDDGDKFSLYLSAEEPTLFREIRGDGRMEFGVFKVD